MELTAGDNMEVGSVATTAQGELIFRCFAAPDGDAVMDRTLIVAARGTGFILMATVAEECVAVGALPDGRTLALGSFGDLHFIEPTGVRTVLAAPPNKSYLTAMKCLGNDVYVCGTRGLLLHLSGEAWNTIDLSTSADLYDIERANDGTLWIVGADGLLSYTRAGVSGVVNFPTDVDLHSIARDRRDRFVVAGAAGQLFVGDSQVWTAIDTDTENDIYAARRFGEHVFLSADEHVLRLDDQVIGVDADLASTDLWIAAGRLWNISLDGVHVRSDGTWQPFPISIDIPDPRQKRARRR